MAATPDAGSSVRSSSRDRHADLRSRTRRPEAPAAPARRRSRAARRGAHERPATRRARSPCARPSRCRCRVSARPREPATQSAPRRAARLSGPRRAGDVCPRTLASSTLRRKTTSSGYGRPDRPARRRVIAEIQPCSVARATIRFAAGSIFSTRPFSLLAAHRSPSAKWSSVAVTGSGKRCCTRPVRASTRTTSAPRASQTEPAPAAIPLGSDDAKPRVLDRPARGDLARCGADAHDARGRPAR